LSSALPVPRKDRVISETVSEKCESGGFQVAKIRWKDIHVRPKNFDLPPADIRLLSVEI
jgi:hypothetical protein